jgi:hypothetical protein
MKKYVKTPTPSGRVETTQPETAGDSLLAGTETMIRQFRTQAEHQRDALLAASEAEGLSKAQQDYLVSVVEQFEAFIYQLSRALHYSKKNTEI